MKLLIFILLVFMAGRLPAADTNLLLSGKWAIDGVLDFPTNLPTIRVVAGKTTVAISELKFFYNFDGVNLVQVFSITGSGTFQPALPAPGEAGGSFQLGTYRDCEQGLIGPLAVTDLVLPHQAKRNGILQLTGKLANGNSLRGDKLVLTFYPPQTNAVQVDVQCRLVATRDFCVDQTATVAQDKFRVVTMTASAVSPTDYDNDLVRYIRVAEKHNYWYGTYVRRQSACVTNQPPGYLIDEPRTLANPWLLLGHTTATPRATPNLLVAIRAPGGAIRPQGFVATPTIELWANWSGIRKSYKARRSVTRLNCSLKATPPRPVSCEWVQQP